MPKLLGEVAPARRAPPVRRQQVDVAVAGKIEGVPVRTGVVPARGRGRAGRSDSAAADVPDGAEAAPRCRSTRMKSMKDITVRSGRYSSTEYTYYHVYNGAPAPEQN